MPETYWDTAKITDRLDVVKEAAKATVALSPGVDDSATSDETRSSGVIDDFEDNDISEYSGDTGEYTVQSTTVKVGSYALEIPNISGDGGRHIQSLSGLDKYPQAGDTFEFWVRSEVGNSATPGFALQNDAKNDCYDILFNDSTLGIRKFSGGSVSTLSSVSHTISAATWYRIVVEWGGGGVITATVYDSSGSEVSNVSANDTTYTGGGIFCGGAGTGGDAWYFDTWKITSTSDTSTTGTIDGFEDGDIAEYEGETSYYSISTSTVKDGSNSLRADHSGGNRAIGSFTGLANYPQAGDSFEGYVYLVNSDDFVSIIFGNDQVNDDGYLLNIENNELDLNLFDNGTYVGRLFRDDSYSGAEGEWLRYTVDWGSGGSITCELYDSAGNLLASGSTNDSTHSSGGFGIETGDRNNTNGTVYTDGHTLN